MDWKEQIRDLSTSLNNLGSLAAAPLCSFFWRPKFFELLLKVSYFFLSIHFGLQGLSKITFWGPWTYLTNNSHCKLRNLVALRGQKSKKTGTCESKAACKFSKKLIPEGFKSRFDTLERKSSTRAFDWCAVRHQSFDLRRPASSYGHFTAEKNFGPNVIY